MSEILDAEIITGIDEPEETVSRLNTLLCKFGLHKWTLWKRREEERMFRYIVVYRHRRCVICGNFQEKEIKR